MEHKGEGFEHRYVQTHHAAEGIRTVKCPYLVTGKEDTRCGAGALAYTPSSFQIEEYCRIDYGKCPFYLANLGKGKGIRSCIILKKSKSL